ncbi:TPA: murein hydrolase activator EnvC [Pseudomonas putida]|jgi:septal ring factor EnvC (AmiA/AmiB activator)|uniref:murein hydrolase activator EnvC family protein n=1 Tax=Pseudomonas TaxID=286 RepID=UPI0007DDDB9A|nr:MULTISPECIES: murein hydrolase activator EnvC [Pseudomonas]ANI32283.1 peptidase M23 [Pseudomonas sp. JY-Q]EKT4503432.1 murein hydrolase activator EnvC [Pseudomonas putida]EKT4568171.1 murein hydrolase activator EnvC [Pseudomonas putida]MCE0901532.1 murein hydrolase activator EnvC [Pseudomonas alloputida]MDD2035177.1 murein hydrolase activator EnvC [Pseudomonas putida]
MLRALILLALSCLLSPAFADERAQTQQQLDATRQDIAELKKTLSKLQEEKAGVQKDLKATETDIGNLEKQVEALQQELKKTEGELERLDTEKKKLQSARVEQQRLIAIQARSAYQNNGREEYLKLLLNQQNPEKFARTLTYYDYLSKARLEQLRTFNETLRQLANVEQAISSQQQQLLAQRTDLDSRRQALETERAKRQQVLAKLNSDVKDRDQKLQAREQDQADLAKVLKTIEETLARQAREAEEARKKALLAQQEAEKRRQQEALAAAAARDRAREPAEPAEPVEPPKKARTTLGPMVSSDGANYGGAFSAARGKLPWPVNGRLLARFGDARGSDARAKWDGVMISANPGTQVRAVHGGRVVFADWLRGAGLLVILDHGNGYLSLYGHNQSLLKNAGDIVKAGEAISTVGDSGGQDAAGLYFAIRQQGRPADPSQWCRG